MLTRPVIAITCGGRDHLPSMPELYITALKKAGGWAEFVYPDSDPKKVMSDFDGVLVPGGRDIDPVLYRQIQNFELRIEIRDRTEFELSLIKEAIKSGKPILGICYGIQVINVFFGGDLFQDIESEIDNCCNHRIGMHTISAYSNPYFETGEYMVNSSHHQAINNVGRGLLPFAFSSDGIAEAIYSKDLSFLVGVQWHPERIDSILSDRLFKSFAGACSDNK